MYIKFNILLFLLILLSIKLLNTTKYNYNPNKYTILITGSTSGIGRTFANCLESNKYQIVITGTNNKAIKEIVDDLKKKKFDVIGINANFTKIKNIYKLYNKIIKKFGKIDILINNMYDMKNIIDIQNSNENEIISNINTNLINVIILTKMVLKQMKENKINGKIVNLSSEWSNINGSLENGNIYPEMYILIKNSFEKITKLLSKNNYKNKISISCIRIDEGYKSNITKRFIKDYDSLKEPTDLITLFKYILETNWEKTTGRILSSKDFRLNMDISKLELNLNGYNTFNLYNQIQKKKNQKLKFIMGENYLGMSPKINQFMKTKNWDFSKYSFNNNKLLKTLAKKHNINENNIMLNNGTVPTISIILNKFIKPYHDIIYVKPSWYLIYLFSAFNNLNLITSEQIIKQNELQIDFDDILSKITSLTRIIYLIMPINHNNFKSFINKIPNNIIVIVDYCYDEFYEKNNKLNINEFINSSNQIICLHSFSKFYSLANLQIGYLITNKNLINLLKSNIFYPLPNFKEEIALIAINDVEHNNKIKKYYQEQKLNIIKNLNINKIPYIDSYQNYLYVKCNKQNELKEYLKNNNIDYDYLSELNGYILFYIDNPRNNKLLLDIILKLNSTI